MSHGDSCCTLYKSFNYISVFCSWVQNFLRSVIPLFVLIILNTCIINALRKERVKGESCPLFFLLNTSIINALRKERVKGESCSLFFLLNTCIINALRKERVKGESGPLFFLLNTCIINALRKERVKGESCSLFFLLNTCTINALRKERVKGEPGPLFFLVNQLRVFKIFWQLCLFGSFTQFAKIPIPELFMFYIVNYVKHNPLNELFDNYNSLYL